MKKKYFIVVAEKTHRFYMQYKSLSELTGITPPSDYTPPRMMTKTRRYKIIKAICQKLKPLDRI
ncbi:hypothetical protein CFN00_27575 [Klebsiella pneumoniae]|nr:hypothetical protein [Klebsiella pneumoniae]HBX2471062.1 hypothetical protein [Klebsiella pneumoniae]HBY4114893.1 hypothetical protein [Klebsiella pneumoniae]HBY5588533.1 hypothetical protein [Klebsiella pneumoniae]HBZ1035202.1 hypothetical protein [Klebsiella pneumoniae]